MRILVLFLFLFLFLAVSCLAAPQSKFQIDGESNQQPIVEEVVVESVLKVRTATRQPRTGARSTSFKGGATVTETKN